MRSGNNCVAKSQPLSAGRQSAIQKANQARNSFLLRKVAVTRGVFMGLLKRGCTSVIQPAKKQPYKDGTVFRVHDFRTLCAVLMRTYMQVS